MNNIKQYIFPNNSFIYLIIFIISKVVLFFFLDIKLSPINYGYHLLDISLLQNDLIQSLKYLHSQPLLWNFFNGLVVKFFDGNLNSITIFFTLYHYFLTWFIFCLSNLLLNQFHKNKRSEIILFAFVIFNPTIIFYENIFSYAHTTCALFALLSYFTFKIFQNKKINYEIYAYLVLLILSSIWLLFQPILIILSFILICVYKKFNKIRLIGFLLIFIISLIPSLKNKIIFDTFTFSSKSGQDFGTVFYDWENYCGHPIKDKEKFTKKYKIKYNRDFNHPSLIGDISHFNNLGLIVLGEECFKKTLNRIKNEPLYYAKGRILAFLSSHGKFGFDYVYPNPKGWDKYYKGLKEIYENKNYKLIRQFLVFFLMITIYSTLCYITFSKSYKNIKPSLILTGLFYTYLISVGTLAGGTEQERIMYTGFFINIIFVATFLDILRKRNLK